MADPTPAVLCNRALTFNIATGRIVC